MMKVLFQTVCSSYHLRIRREPVSEVEVHQPVPGAGVLMLPPEEGKEEEFQMEMVRRFHNLSILSHILINCKVPVHIYTCACNLPLHTHSTTDTPDKETALPTAAPGSVGHVRCAVGRPAGRGTRPTLPAVCKSSAERAGGPSSTRGKGGAPTSQDSGRSLILACTHTHTPTIRFIDCHVCFTPDDEGALSDSLLELSPTYQKRASVRGRAASASARRRCLNASSRRREERRISGGSGTSLA